MNQQQQKMWDLLQDNCHHRWLASELIGKPVDENKPFLDPVMSAAFSVIAVIAVINFFG